MKTVVIGVGNPVRRDDAAGLAVARRVRERLAGRSDVDVTELWAGGLRLVEAMVGYDRAVVVDAMSTGRHAPGTVCRLSLADLGSAHNLTCVHDASLPTGLEIFRQCQQPLPSDILVWGIEGADLGSLSEELSEPVQSAIAPAVEAILCELGLEGEGTA